jgi:D-ribose pyranase
VAVIASPRREVIGFSPYEHRIAMLKSGILNPKILDLLARVRHTNLLAIADRGFPFWPQIETVDISLVDDIPTVLDVVAAIRPNFVIAEAWMAEEFLRHNDEPTQLRFQHALAGLNVGYLAHVELKRRIPAVTGLIRTADTVQYANLLLSSG